VIKVK